MFQLDGKHGMPEHGLFHDEAGLAGVTALLAWDSPELIFFIVLQTQ